MFYICRMTDDGQWQGLRSTHDQDYAEAILDYYCEQFPNAYLDILSYEEYHGGPAKWEAMSLVQA